MLVRSRDLQWEPFLFAVDIREETRCESGKRMEAVMGSKAHASGTTIKFQFDNDTAFTQRLTVDLSCSMLDSCLYAYQLRSYNISLKLFVCS